jgi:hypothetical protein
MLSKFLILLFVFLLGSTESVMSQSNAGPPKKEQSMKSKRKMRIAERKKWREDRANKKAEEKRLHDYQKRTQTKEVRKRMKKSKEKAIRNNNNQREPFFERMFKNRKGKSSKAPKERRKKIRQ